MSGPIASLSSTIDADGCILVAWAHTYPARKIFNLKPYLLFTKRYSCNLCSRFCLGTNDDLCSSLPGWLQTLIPWDLRHRSGCDWMLLTLSDVLSRKGIAESLLASSIRHIMAFQYEKGRHAWAQRQQELLDGAALIFRPKLYGSTRVEHFPCFDSARAIRMPSPSATLLSASQAARNEAAYRDANQALALQDVTHLSHDLSFKVCLNLLTVSPSYIGPFPHICVTSLYS